MNFEAFGGFEIFKNTQNIANPDNLGTEGGSFEKCADSLAYFNKNVQSIVGRADNYQLSNRDFGFKNIVPTTIWNTGEGQIDTGRTMITLLRLAKENNILIFNGFKIKNLTDDTEGGVCLETEDGWDLKVKKVVVATNGFARRLMPELEVKPARNQVLITKPIPNFHLKGGFHYDKGYLLFPQCGQSFVVRRWSKFSC